MNDAFNFDALSDPPDLAVIGDQITDPDWLITELSGEKNDGVSETAVTKQLL
jgi:hypothetical protein